MNITIDTKAPVYWAEEIELNVLPETIWKALSKLGYWPIWQKNVTYVSSENDLTQGMKFKWKASGLTFRSAIHTFSKSQYKLGWTGKTIGTSAIHNWELFSTPTGTKIRVSESLNGMFPRLFKKKFTLMLRDGMRKNLQELKEFTEAWEKISN